PDVEEESINDGRLTIAYDQEGNLCAIQKGQASGLKVEEIMEMVKMGKEKVPEIREMIRGALEKNG
ncbi:MAG: RNA-binding protein, partial [Nitrososphaerota archaeon]|nr:RNA-binding protein [Nitrososphaerota archaeon]